MKSMQSMTAAEAIQAARETIRTGIAAGIPSPRDHARVDAALTRLGALGAPVPMDLERRRKRRGRLFAEGDVALFLTPPGCAHEHHNGETVVLRTKGAEGDGMAWIVADPMGRTFVAYDAELHRVPKGQPREGLADTNQGCGYWEWVAAEQEREERRAGAR